MLDVGFLFRSSAHHDVVSIILILAIVFILSRRLFYVRAPLLGNPRPLVDTKPLAQPIG